MVGQSSFSHDEMAGAFAARAIRCGGVAEWDWEPAEVPDPDDGYEGDWVVRWDVPDERLAELVGPDASAALLQAQERYAARGEVRP